MRISKSPDIEDLIEKNDDETSDPAYEQPLPGRKRESKPIKLQSSQAWRKLEDRLNERSLRLRLKEVYDED